MNSSNKRPLSVTILAYIYIAVGAAGFIFHFRELQARNLMQDDVVWVELTEAVAILSGVFLLRGKNWARWLALAWMAFHVILSYHDLRNFVVHSLFCAIIAWCVFRPEAARYFREAGVKST